MGGNILKELSCLVIALCFFVLYQATVPRYKAVETHQSPTVITEHPDEVNHKGVLDSTSFQNIKLTDQDHQSLSLAALKGKTVVINFMFASCLTVCPTQTAALRQAYNKIEQTNSGEIVFLSISIAPLSDTPEVMKQFAKRFSVDQQYWRFVVADLEATESLVTQFGITPQSLGNGQFDHRTGVYLLNKQGVLVQQYKGNPLNIERLQKEVTILASL